MVPSTVAATQTAAYLTGVAFDDIYNGGGGAANDRPVYYHGDQIGTTRRMTGTDASVAGPGTNGGGGPAPTPPTLARSTFTAFGEPIARVQMGGPGSGPVSFRYGYAGAHGYQQGVPPASNDGEPVVIDPLEYPGWLHVGERYYDPACGRFTMRDPIGVAGGLNTYVYCGNEPVTRCDPSGLIYGEDSAGCDWIARNVIIPFAGFFDPGYLARMSDAEMYGISIGVSVVAGCGIAYVGAAMLGGGAASESMIDVSRWGRPGLKAGDWVMKGGRTWWNYLRSCKWQPGMGNHFTPFSAGESFTVPSSAVRWPTGWGMGGWWKGLFGQRIYLPPL